MLTYVLIAINVIAYVWETSTGGLRTNQTLVDHGAMYGPAVSNGEWWRIVSSAFLHGGITHIAFNMFALWQVGTICEMIYRPVRTFVVYMVAMAGSGIAVYWFSYHDVTVGASGAIFGLFGGLAAAGLRLGKPGRALVQQTFGIVVINLILGFTLPNISNAGHLGGLVAGFFAGLAVFPNAAIFVRVADADVEAAPSENAGVHDEATVTPRAPHHDEPHTREPGGES